MEKHMEVSNRLAGPTIQITKDSSGRTQPQKQWESEQLQPSRDNTLCRI